MSIPHRPNVLWVSFEDTSCRFGCYGDPYARTPHAAALAISSLPNASLVCANAQHLDALFAPANFDLILVLHPEPCARPEDAPNRLVNPAFLQQVATVLRPGGKLCVQTDHPVYYAAILALFGQPEPGHFAQARRWVAAGKWGRIPFPGPKRRARDLWPPPLLPTPTAPPPLHLLAPSDQTLLTTFARHYRRRGFCLYTLTAEKR